MLPTVSCDGDVEETDEDEVDRTGSTKGAKFAKLRSIRLPFWGEMWFLATGPLVGVCVIFAELSE